MTLAEFQRLAGDGGSFAAAFLGLLGDLGGLSGMLCGEVSRGGLELSQNEVLPAEDGIGFEEWKVLDDALERKAGEVLCSLVRLCSAMGWDLGEVAGLGLARSLLAESDV